MTTEFKQAVKAVGFSNTEAAEFFGVSVRTVEAWVQDRRTVPTGVWNELRGLYIQMDFVSSETVDQINKLIAAHGKPPEEIELTSSGEYGQWPTQSCALMVAAMVRLKMAA